MLESNPTISRLTRNWLWGLIETDLLDEPCYRLLLPLLAKTRYEHPGGLVFDLAKSLGASAEHAVAAGSAAEIFYSSCSAGDDIQDGDMSEYFDEPLSIQLNTQSQLLSLGSVRLASVCGKSADVINMHRTLSAMLVGQHKELTLATITLDDYDLIARLSAGMEIASCLRMAMHAVEASTGKEVDVDTMSSFENWGVAAGKSVQLSVDLAEGDRRLAGIDTGEVEMYRQRVVDDLLGSCECLILNIGRNEIVERCTRLLVAHVWNSCGEHGVDM
jgi:hypothetical protein